MVRAPVGKGEPGERVLISNMMQGLNASSLATIPSQQSMSKSSLHHSILVRSQEEHKKSHSGKTPSERGGKSKRSHQHKEVKVDQALLTTVQFKTTIDVDKFLSMPLYKKMLVAEIPQSRYAFADKAAPKLVDLELADPALFNMSREDFVQHFQGFWVQK